MSREIGICGTISVTCGASSSGAGLYMPISATIKAAAIEMKTAAATAALANASGFWTAVDLTHTPMEYETVKLAASADTTEQEIVNFSGAGVLTHVLAPSPGSSGVMTIRVTADGTVHTFVSQTHADQSRFCLGSFVSGAAETSTSGTVGIGSRLDAGFSITAEKVSLPTPTASLSYFNTGIVYESTLIVSIQCSVNVSATAERLNAYVGHTLGIPTGLV